MVDFNNETTVSTPASDVVRILILQRRNDVIEAFEHYYKMNEGDVTSDLEVVKARINSLYLEIQGLLHKRDENMDEVKFNKEIFNADIEGLLKIFSGFNLLLYDINLTKIDNKPQYDTTNIELENKQHNL